MFNITLFNVPLGEGSILSKITTQFMNTNDPNERGIIFANDEKLLEIHDICSKLDISALSEDISIDVNTHFSCLVLSGDVLVELDGREKGPKVHGKCTKLLDGAISVALDRISKYESTGNSYEFSAMILAPE